MSEHTPGPWNAVDDYGRFEIESRLHSIATVNDNDPKHAANARLISAAPELLDALKALVEQIETGEIEGADYDNVQTALAAIRKAEGE